MRRSPAGRLFALVMSALFASHAIEPVSLMLACPMHDAHMGAMAGASMPAMHSMDVASHDPGAAHASDHAPAPDRTPAHAQCTCVGDCTAATLYALAPAPLGLAPAPVASARRAVFRGAVLSPRAAEYIQPFPNGPPRTA